MLPSIFLYTVSALIQPAARIKSALLLNPQYIVILCTFDIINSKISRIEPAPKSPIGLIEPAAAIVLERILHDFGADSICPLQKKTFVGDKKDEKDLPHLI